MLCGYILYSTSSVTFQKSAYFVAELRSGTCSRVTCSPQARLIGSSVWNLYPVIVLPPHLMAELILFSFVMLCSPHCLPMMSFTRRRSKNTMSIKVLTLHLKCTADLMCFSKSRRGFLFLQKKTKKQKGSICPKAIGFELNWVK